MGNAKNVKDVNNKTTKKKKKKKKMAAAKRKTKATTTGPKYVLSAGSGDDFLYEHFVADQWPGVTVVTTDCYQFDEVVTREFDDEKGKILVLPTCLTDKTREYTQFVHPKIRDRFTSYSE